MTLTTNIRIVLVEPSGPLNVGAAARVMKNMGLSRLVIVNPRCDIGSAEAKQMAVHAGDVLAAAEQVETLSQALQGCQRVIATIGRDRAFPIPLEHPQIALPWLLETSDTALVFGREDRGLTNDELKYAQRLVQIPANPDYPSLNLAQSVAICCYELAISTQRTPNNEPRTETSPPSTPSPLPSALHSPPSTFESTERFYQDLETLLLDIGYLHPHTAASRMDKFRRLLNRSSPSDQEIAMLQGILRQAQWALHQQQRNS